MTKKKDQPIAFRHTLAMPGSQLHAALAEDNTELAGKLYDEERERNKLALAQANRAEAWYALAGITRGSINGITKGASNA